MKKLFIGLFTLMLIFAAANTANAQETKCNCECCKKSDCNCGENCKCHSIECTCENCDCTCSSCKKHFKWFKKKTVKCNCENE